MQRSITALGSNLERGVLNDNSTAAVRDLTSGVEKLIEQMRAEQQVVREWADEQAQQQQDLANVIKNITDKDEAKPAASRKPGTKGRAR